ncbi:MAG: sortase [Clostridia bacterium]|nr:sortase [Clostridia bacterium]
MILERIRKISIERKIIYTLLIVILTLLSLLLIKIIQSQNSYDKEKYAKVYEEYNSILEFQNEINTSSDTNSNKESKIKDVSNVAAILDIEKINVFYPIIAETSYPNLKISPTKFYGCNANEVGNFCIVGHNNKNNEQFSNLDKLEIGDTVKLTSNKGDTLKYFVRNKYIVSASDLNCTSQITNGKKVLTLITCTESGKKRLVVKCQA